MAHWEDHAEACCVYISINKCLLLITERNNNNIQTGDKLKEKPMALLRTFIKCVVGIGSD